VAAENVLLDYFGAVPQTWMRDVTVMNIRFGPDYKDFEARLQKYTYNSLSLTLKHIAPSMIISTSHAFLELDMYTASHARLRNWNLLPLSGVQSRNIICWRIKIFACTMGKRNSWKFW
jgi:hypothetical protein